MSVTSRPVRAYLSRFLSRTRESEPRLRSGIAHREREGLAQLVGPRAGARRVRAALRTMRQRVRADGNDARACRASMTTERQPASDASSAPHGGVSDRPRSMQTADGRRQTRASRVGATTKATLRRCSAASTFPELAASTESTSARPPTSSHASQALGARRRSSTRRQRRRANRSGPRVHAVRARRPPRSSEKANERSGAPRRRNLAVASAQSSATYRAMMC